MFELGEEPLDQVALAIETLAEAGLPLSIGFGGNVGRCTLFLDQHADAVGVIGFVRKHDHVRPEMVEQFVGNLPIMCLASS